MHEPEARRRRWFIRLGAALVIATLLVLGGVQAQRVFFKDKDAGSQSTGEQTGNQDGKDSSTQDTAGGVKPTEAVVQSPQQNTPLPASGSSSGAQPNTTTNNSTVRKPD